MSTPEFLPRSLTDKEQETFRRDFQDKEREIQRYIGVYLSGLVIVTGWVIGPQSRPIIAMALGNGGYNIYAFLIFLVLNVVFTLFLINKSLIIHEITQFMTYLAKSDSSYVYWDGWRRSRQSATKPVRSIYTASLGVLPICVSVLLMYGVASVLYRDPAALLQQLQQSENAAAPQDNRSLNSESHEVIVADISSEHLASVYRWAKVWFAIVGALHFFPLYFFYHNWIPTKRRWERIHQLQGSGNWFDQLKERPAGNNSFDVAASETVIKLYDKTTRRPLGTITEKQLRFLQDNLEEESSQDRDYYVTKDTLDFLRKQCGDEQLLRLLEEKLGKKTELEIEWRYEGSQ
jgi:hypothetical protein